MRCLGWCLVLALTPRWRHRTWLGGEFHPPKNPKLTCYGVNFIEFCAPIILQSNDQTWSLHNISHNESETSIKIIGSPWKSSMKSSHELYKHQEIPGGCKKNRHQGITAGLGGLLGMARTPQLEVGWARGMIFWNLWRLVKKTGWWQLTYFWNFHPEPWGNDPIWPAYFSNGLKPPTRKSLGFRTPFGDLFWGEIFFWGGKRMKCFKLQIFQVDENDEMPHKTTWEAILDQHCLLWFSAFFFWDIYQILKPNKREGCEHVSQNGFPIRLTKKPKRCRQSGLNQKTRCFFPSPETIFSTCGAENGMVWSFYPIFRGVGCWWGDSRLPLVSPCFSSPPTPVGGTNGLFRRLQRW